MTLGVLYSFSSAEASAALRRPVPQAVVCPDQKGLASIRSCGTPSVYRSHGRGLVSPLFVLNAVAQQEGSSISISAVAGPTRLTHSITSVAFHRSHRPRNSSNSHSANPPPQHVPAVLRLTGTGSGFWAARRAASQPSRAPTGTSGGTAIPTTTPIRHSQPRCFHPMLLPAQHMWMTGPFTNATSQKTEALSPNTGK